MATSNFRKNPSRLIILFTGLVFVSVAIFFTVQYIQSRRTVEVVFSNVKEVRLVEFRTLKLVEVVKKSGDKINISKAIRYKLTYTGMDGYASGDISIDDTNKITVDPYYSAEKLDSLLTDSTLNSIHTVIKSEYTNVLDEYTLQRGKLYHFGDWYSTSLVYKQEYNAISDTLHVIAKKTPEGWKIAADPNITFDRFSNPTVPVDILQEINN